MRGREGDETGDELGRSLGSAEREIGWELLWLSGDVAAVRSRHGRSGAARESRAAMNVGDAEDEQPIWESPPWRAHPLSTREDEWSRCVRGQGPLWIWESPRRTWRPLRVAIEDEQPPWERPPWRAVEDDSVVEAIPECSWALDAAEIRLESKRRAWDV